MHSVLEQYVTGLRVGQSAHFGAMTVFPLMRPFDSPLRYRVLADALADGSVEVREKPAATVPELWLVNHSESLVLVMGGEEVTGGKQNRMVNASFLIAPRSQMALPVTCVEHGRWHHTSERFGVGEAVYRELRRETTRQVKEGLRARGRPVADQGRVWANIADVAAEMSSSSPTGAMHDIYRQQSASLADYERAFPVVEGAVGIAVAIAASLAGLDAFDQPTTAARLWNKLVRSYALDALRSPEGGAPDGGVVSDFLASIVSARIEQYPSPGLGTDLRLESKAVEGSALVYQDVIVHLVAFPGLGGSAHAATTGMARASVRRRQQRPMVS
jgi:hypothetical protein